MHVELILTPPQGTTTISPGDVTANGSVTVTSIQASTDIATEAEMETAPS